MLIWTILHSITSKSLWYSKIFDPTITQYWRAELELRYSHQSLPIIDIAFALLKSAAKGSTIDPLCKWNTSTIICVKCRVKLKSDIISHPEYFNLLSTDIHNNFFDDGWDHDFNDWAFIYCPHVPLCTCTSPHSSLASYIEYYPSNLLDNKLHTLCKDVINDLILNEEIDWHPGSNQQVRDIIHPSMFCYVKGHSKFIDGSTEIECPENIRYQWLPSEVYVASDYQVKITTYINNLNQNKYPKFVPMIEEVFSKFLPGLEKVLSCKLTNCNLQVIVKVGCIILNTKYPGGSWHIEGMPHERIVATCIHYVDVDNITDSFLEFRKPVVINKDILSYPLNDIKYTSHHYGITEGEHHEGKMNRYLGLVKCEEGASVIFPNMLQHRVKEFENKIGEGRRTIIAFFVIDKNNRIVSTGDIPEQQKIVKIEEAKYNREQLMLYRKYYVNEINKEVFERPFSLCEH